MFSPTYMAEAQMHAWVGKQAARIKEAKQWYYVELVRTFLFQVLKKTLPQKHSNYGPRWTGRYQHDIIIFVWSTLHNLWFQDY